MSTLHGLAEILSWLVDPDLWIESGDVPRAQCEWCAEVDAYTTFRVYGRPRPDVLHPVELVEVCGFCLAVVTSRAVAERDGDEPITVEVAQ